MSVQEFLRFFWRPREQGSTWVAVAEFFWNGIIVDRIEKTPCDLLIIRFGSLRTVSDLFQAYGNRTRTLVCVWFISSQQMVNLFLNCFLNKQIPRKYLQFSFLSSRSISNFSSHFFQSFSANP